MPLFRIIPKFWDDFVYWKQPVCLDMSLFRINTLTKCRVMPLITPNTQPKCATITLFRNQRDCREYPRSTSIRSLHSYWLQKLIVFQRSHCKLLQKVGCFKRPNLVATAHSVGKYWHRRLILSVLNHWQCKHRTRCFFRFFFTKITIFIAFSVFNFKCEYGIRWK